MHSWPLIRISLIDGSLSSGSSGPEAGHLVEDFGDEGVQLLGVQREPLDHDILADELLDMLAHLVFRQLFQRREIDLFDQAAMQPHLGVEQLVGMQRIGRRGRRSGTGAAGSGSGNTVQEMPVRPQDAVLGRSRRCGVGRRGSSAVKRPAMPSASFALASVSRASESLSFFCSAGAFGRALGRLRRDQLACSSCVILLPGLTSSSGTPRSIASRTSR